MSIDNALASLAVKDLARSVKWYAKVFGRPADATPMAEVAEWWFERGGGLQVYLLPERAGAGSCTLAVTHLDEEIEKLRGLGIDTGSQPSAKGIKTVMIKDPDGNSIAFAEATGATPGAG
jgi:catechol 2,3-dioxygenase-like lactoylglutathione lyase family enzyme